MKKLLFLIFIFFFLISCGNEPPSISFPIYNILIYQAGSLNLPNDSIYLSMYFVLRDDDGFEDISKVKITHVKSEFSWEITREQLSNYQLDNRTYYGYPFLEYENGKSILLGDYRVEVEDKVANISETFINIEIEGINNDIPYAVPEIKYTAEIDKKNKEIKIKSEKYTSVEIKFLNKQELFNNGRKKFKDEEKIKFDDIENIPSGSQISLRINKDVNENVVYYLKTIIY